MPWGTECKLPEVQEPTGEAYLAAVAAILPYLIGHRSRLQAFEAPGSPRRVQMEQASIGDEEAGLEGQSRGNEGDQASCILQVFPSLVDLTHMFGGDHVSQAPLTLYIIDCSDWGACSCWSSCGQIMVESHMLLVAPDSHGLICSTALRSLKNPVDRQLTAFWP